LAGQISVLSSKWNTYPPGWGGLRNSIQKKGRLRSREGSGSQARSTPRRLVLFPPAFTQPGGASAVANAMKENQCFTAEEMKGRQDRGRGASLRS